jgi:DNA-binding beta-propeller fold protein YncE
LEKNTIDEIENKFKLLENKIEEDLKQLQKHKAKVTSANDKLTSPNPNQAEMFVHVKMGEDAENVANKFIEDTKMKMTVSEIEFHSDRKLIERLKQNKTIGMLTEKTTKTADKLLHITGGQSYCVKDKSDKTCQIYSACYMEDDTIILADNNNSKLKRLDSNNYTITDCYNLPGEPYQICKINKTQAAVTLHSQQEVHFISVDRQMKTTNNIQTDFYCRGIAYANNYLYISDTTSVYIYTMSGRKLKQFSIDQSGQKLFSTINSIAVSKDATRIYVADGNKGLKVLDNNGQIVTTFNEQQLQCAVTYCHLTEAGSVLVCGYASNNVLQFTSDGKLIGEVIKPDSGRPGIWSVCCNQQMSKMCISRFNEDNIEVYDI